jgi:hypothetical protein
MGPTLNGLGTVIISSFSNQPGLLQLFAAGERRWPQFTGGYDQFCS